MSVFLRGLSFFQSKYFFMKVILITCGLLIIQNYLIVRAYAKTTLPHVYDVRNGKYKGFERIVIELSKKVNYKTYLLDKPYRLVLSFPTMNWQAKIKDVHKDKMISKVRFGSFSEKSSRLVAFLSFPVSISHSFYIAPSAKNTHWRLVLDLKQVSKSSYKVSKKENVKKEKFTIVKPVKKNKKFTITIDPGHGGIDPGAHSTIFSSLWEKNITLDVGKRLYNILKREKGIEVHMTRTTDKFVSLQERVYINRNKGSDLFISLHCDSAKSHNARGATIWSLSRSSKDDLANSLASKENSVDLIAGLDIEKPDNTLTKILRDIQMREQMHTSTIFANLVIKEFHSSRLGLKTKSHNMAGFVVLKSPDVPSVLVEMGYISNRKDASLLGSKRGRELIAKALARAVRNYYIRKKNYSIVNS